MSPPNKGCYASDFDIVTAGVSIRATGRPFSKLTLTAKIVAIDVERDVDVLGVQIRAGRIVKVGDFVASQDEATNRVCIACPAFEPIAEVIAHNSSSSVR